MNHFEDEVVMSYRGKLAEARAILENLLGSAKVRQVKMLSSGGHESSTDREDVGYVTLPSIKLPSFSGELTQFSLFWDHFNAMVYNNV